MSSKKYSGRGAKKARGTGKAAPKKVGAKPAGKSARKAGADRRDGRVAPRLPGAGGALGVTGTVLTWEDDPEAQPGRQPVQVPAPNLPTGTLAITIAEAAPPAQVHPVGTSRFRYWAAAEALTRGMTFWGRLLTAGTKWSTATGKLQAHLDFAEDLNAFYRPSAGRLEFCHFTVGGRTVFSGESQNILCHELGHAVLDAVRPQLFNALFVETAAFHESFGDISAILSALQLDSVAAAVLAETGGRLNRATFLSRLAEQLGAAIRQLRPQDVEPDCLRNAVNSFFYRDPATLPTSAPASALSTKPHSFSRVFTGAFYAAFAGMVITDNPAPTVRSLQKVTQDAGRLLIDAVLRAPVVPNYYSQVAAQIIAADESRFARKYRDVLKGAFVRFGLLSLEAAATIVSPSSPVAVASAGMADAADEAGVDDGRGLTVLAVPAASFGLKSPAILCPTSNEMAGFPGAAAAALDTGSLPAPSHSDAIRTFLEDLFRLGRVDIGAHGDPDSQITQPNAKKTHLLKASASGPILLRETFDCGFDGI
jgi:hypothetical protein